MNVTIDSDDDGAISADQGLLALGPSPDRKAPDPEEDVAPMDAGFPVRTAMGQATKSGLIAPRILVDPSPATDADDAAHGRRVQCDGRNRGDSPKEGARLP